MMIVKHAIGCKKAQELILDGKLAFEHRAEIRTMGLALKLEVQCVGCKMKLHFETSPKLKTNSTTQYDINVRAVWGSIVTGNGASHLKEIMAKMDSPSLSKSAFINIEQNIGYWWENVSQEEMSAAGCCFCCKYFYYALTYI